MVKYNSKDIINRAKRIADLENSDFITYNEQVQMLNDCYNEVYQKIINKGDLYFVKEIYMNNGEELPYDFYQLHDITKETIHLKRGDDYKLVNNKLVLINYDNVKVSYFPIPESLFIEADPVEHTLNSNFEYGDKSAIFPYYNDYINISANSKSSSTYNILFRYKDDLVTVETTMVPMHYWMDRNCIYVLGYNYASTTSDRYLKLIQYNIGYSNSLVIEQANYKGFANVYYDNVAIDIPNHIIHYKKGSEYHTFNYIDKVDSIIEFEYPYSGTGFLKDGEVYNSISMVNNECIYIDTETNSYKLTTKQKELAPVGVNPPVLLKVDEETGYGYTFEGSIIYSAFDNTELEYPNNLFFIYMAYKLAVYMKARQNGDYSKLLPLVREAELHFFDTLSNDSNDYTTIENVYTRRRLW